MGHGLGASLLRHGHELQVAGHRNRVPVDDLVAKGAVESSPADIAKRAEAIVICVSTSKVVETLIGDMRPHLRAGQIVLDAGTSNPVSTRKIAASLPGIDFADIPLTGGPDQAERGELGVLCGASPETFARIEPLLACFATTIRHMGPVGAGHQAKLISNFLVTGMVGLVTEAFSEAKRQGIAWAPLYDAMLAGSGNSGVLRKMAGAALEGDFDVYRFSIGNAAKDIGYYCETAGSSLAKPVAEFFAKALERHGGAENVSRLLEKL
jgi:3-hydroxyisobutyrate dehydrogenase-like beta-hydroxyacid dehydrogenase